VQASRTGTYTTAICSRCPKKFHADIKPILTTRALAAKEEEFSQNLFLPEKIAEYAFS
jgi:hypothetical protein